MKLTDKIELFNEDNLQGMARYPDKHFDLAIVDPPYGLGMRTVAGGSKNNTQPKFLNDLKLKKWDDSTPSPKYWDELFRVSKNQIAWGGNYFDLPPYRTFITWDKMTYIPTMSQVELAWTSFDSPARLIQINSNQPGRTHPTQKPVALYAWLLEKYAKPNFKILDTHLGSGSIAIACHQYGCELTGFEIDEDYFEASIHRFKMQTNADYAIANKIKATGQADLFFTPNAA